MSSIRSEKRVVRPFAELGDVDACLEATRLVVNGQVSDSSSVVREADELPNDRFSLQLDVDADAVAAAVQRMDIPEVDIGIAVIATGRSLKASAVLHRSPVLADAVPGSIDLDASQFPDVFGDLRGFDVRCCVVLLHDLQPRALRPHLAGTWLAARDFSVRVRGDVLSAFNPQRMTAEIRGHYALPEGAVTYLAIEDDNLLSVSELADALVFYIDADLFDRLHASQSTPLGQALQRQLVVEFLMGALPVIVKDIDSAQLEGAEDTALDQEAPAGALVHGVAERIGMSPASLCAGVRTDPAKIRACLQAALEVGAQLGKALNRGGE